MKALFEGDDAIFDMHRSRDVGIVRSYLLST